MNFYTQCAISVLICCSVHAKIDITQNQAFEYLQKYGYLSTTPLVMSARLNEEDSPVDRAIRDFQKFAGLNQTGTLDQETLYLMSKPRCGVQDYQTSNKTPSYKLQGSTWKKRHISYRITQYSRKLHREDADTEIERAFQTWSEVTDLSFFRQDSGKVDIEIRFVEGRHGDGSSFDGRGGTLAHAFFPQFGGDAHFDDAEVWTIGISRGTNLFQVAVHEFGHSLGLSHSEVRQALMAPFYAGYQPNFRLHSDDVRAIQALYGRKRTASKPRPTPRPMPTPRPPKRRPEKENELCRNPRIGAITKLANGNTYIFKGAKYWRLVEGGIAKGYPRSISDFPGLPPNIDAAVTIQNGNKTYFFKGRYYWRFYNDKPDRGYPKKISTGFTGIPNDINAAFVWSGNGKLVFMKGTDYWRFDVNRIPHVPPGYPRKITMWNGVPASIDDAFQYSNGKTYFFKGHKYYRFDDTNFKVEETSPSYPRKISKWWLGCNS